MRGPFGGGLFGSQAGFPPSVMPAVWFDGNQPAYTDLAGTQVAAIGALVRRLNERAPLTGVWTTPSDPERPSRDSNALRFEAATAVGHTQMIRGAAAGVISNACTFVCSYMARDNAFAGPVEGVWEGAASEIGIRIGSNTIWVFTNGGNEFSSLIIKQGKRNTIGVRYTPSGIDLWLDVEGEARVMQSFAASPPAVPVSGYRIGYNVGNNGPLYGSCSQMFGIARSLSDAELAACMTWSAAQTLAPAYPTSEVLLTWVGDSIQRATGAIYGLSYPFLSLANVRTAGHSAENSDVAVGGAGVARLLAPIGPNTDLLLRGLGFYNAARVGNVLIFCLGTNDLANGNPPAFCLNGTAPPTVAGSGIYPACDFARAHGMKVALVTIGPRSDAISISNNYNVNRAIVNADILANGHLHADLVVDTTQIVNFGQDGDTNNPTYYNTDLIHPTDAGHALVAPTVSAAILSLL